VCTSTIGQIANRLTAISREAADAAQHDVDAAFARLRERLQRLSPLPLSEWRVLDVGCGYTYPNVLLFSHAGVDVVGLDILSAFYRDGWLARWRSEPEVPLARRTWRWLKARIHGHFYFRRLSRSIDGGLRQESLRLVRYSGGAFPFADGSFNVVVSNAVLEHVADLDLFASEVRRVLAPRGIFDMLWHNFYSWSGNHLPESVNRAHAWGHLTGETEPPATAGLNRARPEDIIRAFGEHLTVSRCVPADRDHRLLGDPDYQAEAAELLSGDYAEELLLSRAYLIQGSVC